MSIGGAMGGENRGVKVAMVGVGAFGNKHLDALAQIPEAKVVVDRRSGPKRPPEKVAARARCGPGGDHPRGCAGPRRRRRRDSGDADAGPRPAGDRLLGGRQARRGRDPAVRQPGRRPGGRRGCSSEASGKVAVCGHTRRFNPSHQWVRNRITSGEYTIQHMDVQTFFFRRTNTNALGEPRTWTDHLLWHHAAHTVDLFQFQTGSPVVAAQAMQGPVPSRARHRHGHVDPAQDRGRPALHAGAVVQQRRDRFGTFFRYIGDTGTYIARYDDLVDGRRAAHRRVRTSTCR